jgi:hypothetical protein
VTTERAKAFADQLGVKYLEVSAKDNIEVDHAFYAMTEDVISKFQGDEVKP